MNVAVLACLLALPSPPPGQPARGGLSAIRLRREECFGGGCPVYEVTFRSDGTATYVGKANVRRFGEFDGKVSPETFRSLEQLLVAQGFLTLKPRYRDPF